TSAGFFIYQSTKKGNDTPISQKTNSTKSQPQTTNSVFVRVTDPSDETLTSKRTVIIKGSTNPNNTLVISSNIEDVEVKPNSEGAFTISIDIDAGANMIITRAISPNGESA